MVALDLSKAIDMCGVLLIDSDKALPAERIAKAERYLQRRGPNLLRRYKRGRMQIWHSVLHVTGDREYYYQEFEDFLAFAGEIYNYHELGYRNDAWCVHDTVRHRPGDLRRLLGPHSWIYSTGEFVCYASDPQGERHLYRYQDQDMVIVASEVGIIAELVDLDTQPSQYLNKGWNLLTHTPYRDVQRLDSGRLYINHQSAHHIDSIFDWCKPKQYPSLLAATEEFAMIWQTVMKDLTPNEPVTVSFSGGVDSGLIAAAVPTADLLALDMQGKDPNIARLHQLLPQDRLIKLNTITISPEYYAGAGLEMLAHTRMPAQSWSHVSKWLVAKHAGHRIVFSGVGADELFGGYQVYQTIDYTLEGSHSPYSRHHDADVWRRCLQAYDNDPAPATLLLDYIYQIMACDSQGLDRAAGAWSREPRSPFMHPLIVKFALGLPWHLRVSEETKPVLKKYWRRFFPENALWPKQGFAGHANDSAPWLGIDIVNTGDRVRDWQTMSTDLFYHTATNQQVLRTTAQ